MRRLDSILPFLACLAIGLALALTIPGSPALGWDESMHAELPAARFALALRAGEIGLAVDALLDCAQYPPAWPAVLGLVQLAGGVDEALARATTTLAWAAAIGCAFVVARRAARGTGAADERAAGWIALAVGALAPLPAAFAGTLFLEVPSALATGFALWAWTRRGEGSRTKRDLVAGLAISVALFTKWNYGLLLGAALALDWFIELIVAVRARRAREAIVRARWLVLVPALASAWWFLLPLPGVLELAREHRAAFAGFLAGNLEAAPASAAERALYSATGIAPTVRAALLVVVLAIVALRGVRAPAVRATALAAIALLGAPLVHPFFLDRFLVPGLVPLFALAGVGLALVLPREGLARHATLGALVIAAYAVPGRDGAWLAHRLGLLPEKEPGRGYVLAVLSERTRLGPGRRLPTAGLERAEHDALIALVAAEVRPGERVAWLGTSSEMSPAALHLGLLARDGDPRWFLERDPPEIDLTYFGTDLGFDDADLRAFAARFDVILWTDPPDLRARVERAFTRAYRERLLALRPSNVRELGTVSISRPLRPSLAVTLSACRPIL